MHLSTRLISFLMMFLAACTLALADPEIHTTLALKVRDCDLRYLHSSLTNVKEIPQDYHPVQKPFVESMTESPYAFAGSQPMQAASDAGSAERPVGKMVVAVLISGVLFGLGMGM